MMELGKKLSPILVEIEDTLLEHQLHVQTPLHFTNDGFRAALKISIDVILDKMWQLQEAEGMDFDSRCKMAEKAGADMRKLVKTYTNIDTHDLYRG